MNASATDVSHGSNVTLSCLKNRSILDPALDAHNIAILQNGSEVNSRYGHSVSAHVLMDTFGKQNFQCFSTGHVSRQLICGIYINVGIPPDQPKNLSCNPCERNGTINCTWTNGNYTYLNTVYELQITKGTTNETQILKMHSTCVSVDFGAKPDFESTYTVVVMASNKLGNAFSLPFRFKLLDIVKPHPPMDISVKFDGSDATNCTIFWQDQQDMQLFRIQQDTQLFRIRFKPINSNSWIMLENVTARRYKLYGLKPDTEYEFQVSCRFFPNKGLWSDWSKSVQTEAAGWSTGLASGHGSPLASGAWLLTDASPAAHVVPSPALPGDPCFQIRREHLKPNVCYHIHVFALYWNREGKAVPTTGDVSAKAPLTGPHINTTVRDGSILVFWTEIPEDQQPGCIVSYKIYVQQKSTSVDSEVYDIPKAAPQPFSVKNVRADAAYTLWMTTSPKARESPKGNERLGFTDEPGWAPILVLCIIGLAVSACCVVCARPQWYNKAVPDPANSSWAKKFTSVEDEPSVYSSQFLNNLGNLEEPETLQIEEVWIKRQSHGFEDVLLSERTEIMESHKWSPDIFQEENPTIDKLNHHPLINDTLDQHQLLFLYKKVASEEGNHGQVFSDYLVNPLEDTTVNYLPSTIVPPITNMAEDCSEGEFNLLAAFPRTFLPQIFSVGGKLTLDAIKMDCTSFTD
ncbi:interleukin-12 receptor subunit beta-2 [Eublepharis macularius]|uniref:Interleukin-12 receptor subunit beta-2 n=1 Tax=Eublepharis macularius TaxID=481883 RepID=A0AA97KZR9_EUBMA|nr:interleukin-12 receptor subunit beta-2 [Eublepharis macularius]